MLHLHELKIADYERVVEIFDENTDLHAFIAIHSTALGPSLGGTRIYPYATREEALEDVLKLSKAMSYKSALAKTGLGGGKSVIIADPKTKKTEALLLSFGEALNELQGAYIAAEDVGSSGEDMMVLRKKTLFVAALPIATSSGDPIPYTAFGVFKGIQAVSQFLWNSSHLKDKTIAIQGLGNVGSKLAHFLFWEGAQLILTDVDEKKLKDACTRYKARAVLPHEIFDIRCDILAPCAMGGIIHPTILPQLKCLAIAGSANNQLSSPEVAALLEKRNILHAPCYVINAGGIINASCEFTPQGYDPQTAREKTEKIYELLLTIFNRARQEGRTPLSIADEIAAYNLSHQIGKRETPISFNC